MKDEFLQVPCYKCKKTIYDSDKTCKHCGYIRTKNSEENIWFTKDDVMDIKTIITFVVLGLVIYLCVWYFKPNDKVKSNHTNYISESYECHCFCDGGEDCVDYWPADCILYDDGTIDEKSCYKAISRLEKKCNC